MEVCTWHRFDDRNVDFAALCRKGIDFDDLLAQGRDVGALIGQTDYLDFRSLG